MVCVLMYRESGGGQRVGSGESVDDHVIRWQTSPQEVKTVWRLTVWCFCFGFLQKSRSRLLFARKRY